MHKLANFFRSAKANWVESSGGSPKVAAFEQAKSSAAKKEHPILSANPQYMRITNGKDAMTLAHLPIAGPKRCPTASTAIRNCRFEFVSAEHKTKDGGQDALLLEMDGQQDKILGTPVKVSANPAEEIVPACKEVRVAPDISGLEIWRSEPTGAFEAIQERDERGRLLYDIVIRVPKNPVDQKVYVFDQSDFRQSVLDLLKECL
jgi:hypothetical protein